MCCSKVLDCGLSQSSSADHGGFGASLEPQSGGQPACNERTAIACSAVTTVATSSRTSVILRMLTSYSVRISRWIFDSWMRCFGLSAAALV
jgi:hypothetical protein